MITQSWLQGLGLLFSEKQTQEEVATRNLLFSLLSLSLSSGSPFRLSIYRGNAECVFLDHIPYQPNSNTYYVTVDVPNLSCSRTSHNCRLVLRQIDSKWLNILMLFLYVAGFECYFKMSLI